jgi:tRNA (guanine-N7-)-methyltransferase
MSGMSEQSPRRRMEREFGVPFAGEILDPSQWTRTALKKLPAEGPLDLVQIFGRTAPLVVDVGCGNGRFLLSSAVWRPQYDHLGVDILPMVIRYATRRANQRGLRNIRFAVVDGERLLRQYLPAGSIQELHCYHPQPYHDFAKAHRRLITPTFLALVHRALVPGGLFVLQTDSPAYWRYMQEVVPHFFDFREQPGRWPDAPKGRTRREIVALRRGLPVFRGWGHPRPGLDEAAYQHLIATLPLPTFRSEGYLRRLDLEEQDKG